MSDATPMTLEVEALANLHSHIREGEVVGPLLKYAIEGGADVLCPMPNTSKGLTTADEVSVYIDRARDLVDRTRKKLALLPVVMVTEYTTFKKLEQCVKAGICNAKVYPLDRTTKSHNGVRHYSRILPQVKRGGELGMKFHLHPEHPWMVFGSRDAELAFLPIADMLLNETKATLIWEHGTDGRCIPFWKDMAGSGRFFVTLTAHHLATNEDQAFGDVRSVCKPPIKTKQDQSDLVKLVEEDHEWVMTGADDAPHPASAKHVSKGGCACGAYTAPFLLPLYAHALDRLLQTQNGVSTFVRFTSRNGRRFHDLSDAWPRYMLVRRPFKIPLSYRVGPWTVEPFWAGQTINWSLVPWLF